jgi:maleylacetate reductase
MIPFNYKQEQRQIIFGYPAVEAIANELSVASSKSVWVIASHRHDALIQQLAEIKSLNILEHFSRVLQHVPQDQVQKARHTVAKLQPDIIIAIGGGSAIGLAKAVALKHPIPIWAVPTTYSGSEMTDIYGISSADKKMVGRDPKVTPKKVFYDPSLSLSLPFDTAVKSAVNALAHLVEALYSPKINPFTIQYVLEGLRLLVNGLQNLVDEKSLSADINEKLLLGACFGGKALAEADMALHHKCAHVLGGRYGLDHASVHTVLLPYVLDYQWNSLEDEIKDQFRDIFKSEYPPKMLKDVITGLGQPASLADIGFSTGNAGEAAEEISRIKFNNPAQITPGRLKAMLEKASAGDNL